MADWVHDCSGGSESYYSKSHAYVILVYTHCTMPRCASLGQHLTWVCMGLMLICRPMEPMQPSHCQGSLQQLYCPLQLGYHLCTACATSQDHNLSHPPQAKVAPQPGRKQDQGLHRLRMGVGMESHSRQEDIRVAHRGPLHRLHQHPWVSGCCKHVWQAGAVP
jgi:hypothetical protein